MKTPPHFAEGEAAILGACLIDNSCIPRLSDILTPSDFYQERNRITFAAIMEIHDRGGSPDWVSVTAALQKIGKFEAVGGSEFLTNLVDAVPSAANVMHFAEIVRDKSKLRQVILAAAQVTARCYDSEVTLDEVMQDFQKSAFEIAVDVEKSDGLIHVSEVLQEGITAIEQAGTKGIKTGLGRVDQIFDGFFEGDLTIIGGRPSMGKSAFVMDILDYVSRQIPCGFFSVEMPNSQNGVRLLAKKTGINLRNLRRGLVSPSDWPRLVDASGRLAERKLYIDQSPYLTTTRIRNRVRHLAVSRGVQLGLIAIDYLQLMSPNSKQQTRDREIGSISRDLKLLAREFGIPVIALSQLNRKLEERPAKNCGRRPMLSDLRDSGSLEQDADAVMFVFRQEVYEPENSDVKSKAEIIISKQRNGAIGPALVSWDATTATFRDPEVFHDESKYMEAV
jgi:replicative DNA helicase